MTWKNITTTDQVDEIISKSNDKIQLIFKHSTTCSISSMAKMRLESDWDIEDVDTYYLDLLAYRPVSNYIAEVTSVHHESPQIIVLRDGEVILDASHLDITVAEVKEVEYKG